MDKNTLPLGKIEEGEKLMGRAIEFTELKDRIGDRFLYEGHTDTRTYYRIIKLTSYHEDADHITRNGKVHTTCDRIGYSDNKRNERENCGSSEIYFTNGRFDVESVFPKNTLYEIAA